MSEPKWTPIDEVTDWSLGWWVKPKTPGSKPYLASEEDAKTWGHTQVWGPFQIPDPPPPLPTLHRFTATHNGNRVAGMYCSKVPISGNQFRYVNNNGYFTPVRRSVLTDIKWIDEEPSQ